MHSKKLNRGNKFLKVNELMFDLPEYCPLQILILILFLHSLLLHGHFTFSVLNNFLMNFKLDPFYPENNSFKYLRTRIQN